MSGYLNEDIKNLINTKEFLSAFERKSVLVTGSTGLIGSLIIKCLLEYNKKWSSGIRVIGLAHNMSKAESVFKKYLDFEGFELIPYDIVQPFFYQDDIDYIIHTASITSSKEFIDKPVQTLETAIIGTNNLLKLAYQKKVKGFLYLSSLEVYGVPFTNREEISSVTENDYGYLDPLSVRSSYSEGKRCVENLCIAYASEYAVPVKIARLTQTFGPGVDYYDSRVFAEFARAVIEENDITLHTKGETVRNYCYTADAVKALFLVLTKGKVGEAYNVANQRTTVSIYEMAQIAASLSNGKTKVIIMDDNPPEAGYNPPMKVTLSAKKLETLGWTPQYGIKEMFMRMISDMIVVRNMPNHV